MGSVLSCLYIYIYMVVCFINCKPHLMDFPYIRMEMDLLSITMTSAIGPKWGAWPIYTTLYAQALERKGDVNSWIGLQQEIHFDSQKKKI